MTGSLQIEPCCFCLSSCHYDQEKAAKAALVASPPGVPPPPIVPTLEPGKFGFVDNAVSAVQVHILTSG